MTETRHILYAFDNENMLRSVGEHLSGMGVEADYECKYNRLGLESYLASHPECDTLIVQEYLERRSPFRAEELAALNDERDLNIIVILDEKHRGTDYMKILYAAGITSALFSDSRVTFSTIADLVKKKRTRKEARQYYHIENGLWETSVIEPMRMTSIITFLEDTREEIPFSERYEYVVGTLTHDQNVFLLAKLPVSLRDKCLAQPISSNFVSTKKRPKKANPGRKKMYYLPDASRGNAGRIESKDKGQGTKIVSEQSDPKERKGNKSGFLFGFRKKKRKQKDIQGTPEAFILPGEDCPSFLKRRAEELSAAGMEIGNAYQKAAIEWDDLYTTKAAEVVAKEVQKEVLPEPCIKADAETQEEKSEQDNKEVERENKGGETRFSDNEKGNKEEPEEDLYNMFFGSEETEKIVKPARLTNEEDVVENSSLNDSKNISIPEETGKTALPKMKTEKNSNSVATSASVISEKREKKDDEDALKVAASEKIKERREHIRGQQLKVFVVVSISAFLLLVAAILLRAQMREKTEDSVQTQPVSESSLEVVSYTQPDTSDEVTTTKKSETTTKKKEKKTTKKEKRTTQKEKKTTKKETTQKATTRSVTTERRTTQMVTTQRRTTAVWTTRYIAPTTRYVRPQATTRPQIPATRASSSENYVGGGAYTGSEVRSYIASHGGAVIKVTNSDGRTYSYGRGGGSSTSKIVFSGTYVSSVIYSGGKAVGLSFSQT